jgi:uncharacterized protein
MTIDFDLPKSLKNARERGLSFEAVERFDWETCLLGLSPRQEMTATRFLAVGFLDEDLVVVFTIHAAGIRVISLRRASRSERKFYAAQEASDP